MIVPHQQNTVFPVIIAPGAKTYFLRVLYSEISKC